MQPDRIAVIIPALDEEAALPAVLSDLGALGLLATTIVVDNGSRDRTALVAAEAGAAVEREPRRGYGAACLRGIATARGRHPQARVLLFLDADRSDDPSMIPALVDGIEAGRCDLVIGSRALGHAQPGALQPHQRLGNAFVCAVIRCLFGHRYTDLGPFRAISVEALDRLEMRDKGFGWTVEMQVKALQAGLRVAEVPVPYRRRVGTSKISGTLRGSAGAAMKIGWTVAALRMKGGAARRPPVTDSTSGPDARGDG
jgi:glycosyltransferase involved in cell wall biosynthesis